MQEALPYEVLMLCLMQRLASLNCSAMNSILQSSCGPRLAADSVKFIVDCADAGFGAPQE